MKTVRILALHLDYGGVEKAIISMANLLAERYDVEIISVYDMPAGPAFPLDRRVRVRYLLDDIPNRDEWKAAIRSWNPLQIGKESLRAVRILRGKKKAVEETIRSIHDGVLITTRHEDNLCLSRLGDKNVLKIAQLHHDHNFEKKYVKGFKNHYGNIDVFTLLTPGLVDEVKKIMGPARHTRVVWLPNFLEHYPERVDFTAREKTLLAVGRLDPVKGFDRILRCFAAAHALEPGWTLRIIGEGADRSRLEKLIRENGLSDCVTLAGRMSGEQVEEEMKRAGIYAMGSYNEGFGFVIIEAQSCGLPTVAFDVRVGPGMILTDREDGFLVPDGDEEQYTARLLDLMRSADLRRQMGKNAIRRSHDFSREAVGKRLFDIIEDRTHGEE